MYIYIKQYISKPPNKLVIKDTNQNNIPLPRDGFIQHSGPTTVGTARLFKSLTNMIGAILIWWTGKGEKLLSRADSMIREVTLLGSHNPIRYIA